MSISTLVTKARPSRIWDFANSGVLDPSITFTRASTGLYTDKDGVIKVAPVNIPRFDYAGYTGQCKGLLVEEGRTNLVTYSAQIDNAAWVKVASGVTANAVTAPDNTLTADKLIADTSASSHAIYQTRTGTNETLTISVYAKSAEKTSFRISLSNSLNSSATANFDLVSVTTGTSVSGSDYSSISSSIIPLNNGWFRCILTATKAAVNTVNNPYIELGASAFTGDNTSGIYIWGIQLEQGNGPTSYIPTTSSTVTRSADVASITGTALSSWYNNTEGTMQCSYTCAIGSSFYPSAWYFQDEANTSRFGHVVASGSKVAYFEVIASGTNMAVVGSSNTSEKVTSVFAFKTDDVAGLVKGDTLNVDTTVTINPVTRLYIGGRNAEAQLNGCIARLAYYSKRLSDVELQNM